MQIKRSRLRPVGTYTGIFVLVYGVTGAITNDLFIPGKRTAGVHLHYDAIPPALLGIGLFAFASFLEDFNRTSRLLVVRRVLMGGAICCMFWSLYFIVNPYGKRVATTPECEETFSRLGSFASSTNGDNSASDFFAQRAAQCIREPILRSFHDCVQRANTPTDVNECHAETRDLYERKNAT
jgi:hypothetical protein